MPRCALGGCFRLTNFGTRYIKASPVPPAATFMVKQGLTVPYIHRDDLREERAGIGMDARMCPLKPPHTAHRPQDGGGSRRYE